jgi:hypothetical protein
VNLRAEPDSLVQYVAGVGRQQDLKSFLLAQAFEESDELPLVIGVEVSVRLVQDQQLRRIYPYVGKYLRCLQYPRCRLRRWGE